ncbi:hypothetical protein WS69_03260 [Burkholderia sp. BDU5]|nr:hypothetical protein WS69_03260 [Burkholderia sp. BDU5]
MRIVSLGAELDAEQAVESQRLADRRRDQHVGGGHGAARIARIAMPLHERAASRIPDRRPDHVAHEPRAPRIELHARQGSRQRPRRFFAMLAPATPRRASHSDEASR